jgi:hypothetical protein
MTTLNVEGCGGCGQLVPDTLRCCACHAALCRECARVRAGAVWCPECDDDSWEWFDEPTVPLALAAMADDTAPILTRTSWPEFCRAYNLCLTPGERRQLSDDEHARRRQVVRDLRRAHHRPNYPRRTR